ncbi:MAG: hypothetical protein AAFX87_02835 [Bacteroidota bacterium]
MPQRKFGSIFLILLLLAGVFACDSGGKKDADKEGFEKAKSDADADIKDQVKDVVYNIPTPSEIPYILESTGAEFNEALINDHNNADNYLSTNDKASLNLGVFATDVGYLSSYGKVQEAINYLNASKKLADYLGVTGSFDVSLINKFEQNLSDRKALASLLDSTIQKTDTYLKDENRSKLAALIITGSFVEGLYVSTKLVETYPKDILSEEQRNLVLTKIIREVLNQKESVKDVIGILEGIEQTEEITALVNSFKQLQTAYDSLNFEEQLQNSDASTMLSDKNLLEIGRIIDEVRTGIVG